MKRNIVLVGMMGSGKSHIGRKLAARLQWQFVDTDRRIERFVGKSIAEFYAEQGEAAFRERELNVLQQVSRYHEAIISFGGNFPMSLELYRVLHRFGYIVALQSEPFRVEERVGRHVGKRPTVDYDNLHEFVMKMMGEWREIYPYCDFVVDTTTFSAGQIVDKIIEKIEADEIVFASRAPKEE
ncbi:shikimate kinase [Megasphaera paucivorans]|uniref:Shikimate kinase n=1 Tax=Megasphaera paucivorans TaxID=349095 RepID=A0A1G9UGF2_9FIRM|nr:shikimate kinase [Megasphaera paucivorans]SDM59017.1 shikimate kinase [Megasphaera paucivorans]